VVSGSARRPQVVGVDRLERGGDGEVEPAWRMVEALAERGSGGSSCAEGVADALFEG
jgi:hypothetical protein